jgi:Ca2+-binding RTX toxin-like protein
VSYDPVTDRVTVSLGVLPDGRYTLTALGLAPPAAGGIQDRAGNPMDGDRNPATPGGNFQTTFDVDRTPPVVVFDLDPMSDSGVAGDRRTNQNRPTFRGSVTEALPGGPDGLMVRIDVDGDGPDDGLATTAADGSFTITPSTPIAPDTLGRDISVHVTDRAGNVGMATVRIAIDTTPPSATFALDPVSDTGLPGDAITKLTRPTFRGSVLDAAPFTDPSNAANLRVDLDVDGDGFDDMDGSAVTNASGDFQVTAANPIPAGQPRLVRLRITDRAGNIAIVTTQVTVDTTPPRVLTFTPTGTIPVRPNQITAALTADDLIAVLQGDPLYGSSALNPANYTFTGQFTNSRAQNAIQSIDYDPVADRIVVTLDPSKLTIDNYTFTISSNITDIAGNRLAPEPGFAGKFTVNAQDRFEANNTIATAKDLGTVVHANYNDLTIHLPTNPADLDFFKVTAAATGTMEFSIDISDPLASPINLQLVDSSGRKLQDATGPADHKELTVPAQAGQMFFLKIFATSGAGYYSLGITNRDRFELTPSVFPGDPAGPNDTPATAVNLGVVRQAEFDGLTVYQGSPADEDWFRITTKFIGAFTTQVFLADPTAAVKLEIYRPNDLTTPVATRDNPLGDERIDMFVDRDEVLFARVVPTGPTAAAYDIKFTNSVKLVTKVFGNQVLNQLVVVGTGGDDTLRTGVRLEANGSFTSTGNITDIYIGGATRRPTTYNAAQLVDALLVSRYDRIRMNGGRGNDTLVADPAVTSPTELRGGGGNDTVRGGSGDDTLYGGTGNDLLVGGDGNDAFQAGDGDDTVDAGNGNDRVNGGPGNDLIMTGAGNDVVSTEDGNDTILAGDGNDSVCGGAGSDQIHGEGGNDLLAGGPGVDFLFGEAGFDSLYVALLEDQVFDIGPDGGNILNETPDICAMIKAAAQT